MFLLLFFSLALRYPTPAAGEMAWQAADMRCQNTIDALLHAHRMLSRLGNTAFADTHD